MGTESVWVDDALCLRAPRWTPHLVRQGAWLLWQWDTADKTMVGHELSQWIMLGSRKNKNIGEQSSP